jgi:hypothetical protein
MTDLSGMRASDAERETVVGRLQHATAEGRLSLDELGDRVARAYAARIRSDLDQLVDDLPVPPEPVADGPSGSTATTARAMAILAVGVSAIPASFYTPWGTVLGPVAILLGVVTLGTSGPMAPYNRAAIAAGVVCGALPLTFFLALFWILGA